MDILRPKGFIVGQQDPNAKTNLNPITDEELGESIERIDELVGLLLDDQLDDEQMGELGKLIETDADARSKYVGLMQLHADLTDFFNPPKEQDPKNMPVLGFLADDFPAPGMPQDTNG